MLPKKPFQPFFSAPSNSKKLQDIVLSKGKDIFLASTLMMAAPSPPHHRHRLQAQAMLDTWRPFLFFLKVILSTSPPVRNHFQRNSSGSGPALAFPWLGLAWPLSSMDVLWMLLQNRSLFLHPSVLAHFVIILGFHWGGMKPNEAGKAPRPTHSHRWVV